MRAALALALLATTASAVGAAPDDMRMAPPGAYVCRAFVTGTDERDRASGLARCWAEVLTKVSGDPLPLAAPDPLPAPPAGAVAGLYYLDRMTTLARHDEQGTRDRPFDLVVRFDPGAVAAALDALGEVPWPAPPPRLLVRVTLERDGRTTTMTAAEPDDEAARHILDDAAQRFGVTLSFAAEDGDALPLVGRLVWSDRDHGWNARWSVREATWFSTGEALPAALRGGILGALAIASGHAVAATRAGVAGAR